MYHALAQDPCPEINNTNKTQDITDQTDSTDAPAELSSDIRDQDCCSSGSHSSAMEDTLLYSFLIILLAGPVVLVPAQTPAILEVTSKRNIVHAFLDGLKSLQCFADSLQTCGDRQLDLERDLLPGLRATLQSMSRAQEVCQVQVNTLRSNQEEHLNRIKALKDQLSLLEARLNGLKQQLSGLQALEASSRHGVAMARRALDAAQSALDQITQQANNAQQLFNLHLFNLLHLNLFRISFMISDNGAISSGKNRVNEARRSLNAQLNTMNMYVAQRQSCSQSVDDTLRSIADIKGKIMALHPYNKRDILVQKQFTNFLLPMSQCNSFLRTMVGQISGGKQKAHLKNVSQLLHALVPVLDDLVKAVRPLVRNDSTYQLLIALRLYTIIDKLEQANQKMKETSAAREALVRKSGTIYQPLSVI
ncbi:hypothetical protein NDU88_000511 [Pleurodeles waltl]|uniref:Uncharacterized protein n=2 Tax=Pleurodeles waltl TaxID=8319 RepID=A0AAV7WJW8_PLEWA|nr:hypothetical protein NDU88_000511 [Pleurodeles waltl]